MTLKKDITSFYTQDKQTNVFRTSEEHPCMKQVKNNSTETFPEMSCCDFFQVLAGRDVRISHQTLAQQGGIKSPLCSEMDREGQKRDRVFRHTEPWNVSYHLFSVQKKKIPCRKSLLSCYPGNRWKNGFLVSDPDGSLPLWLNHKKNANSNITAGWVI